MKAQIVLSVFTGFLIFIAAALTSPQTLPSKQISTFEQQKEQLEIANAALKEDIQIKDVSIIKDLSKVQKEVDTKTIFHRQYKCVKHNASEIDTVYAVGKRQSFFDKLFKRKKPD